MNRKKRNVSTEIIFGLCFGLTLALLVVLWLSGFGEPRGHYEATTEMQPDGNYYIWVDE